MGHVHLSTVGQRTGCRFLPALMALIVCACLLVLPACGSDDAGGGTNAGGTTTASQVTTSHDTQIATQGKVQTFTPKDPNGTTLVIASGSENKEAQDAIALACSQSHVTVELHYMGSVDIMNLLADGAQDYDAVWPASSIWISMGDSQHLVKDQQSTSTTPIVLGVSQQKVRDLGWTSQDGATISVTTADILQAVREGKLSFAMTSATQSNSGASAYLAFLTALAGKDQPLTSQDLDDQALQNDMKSLLAGQDRSSGSSDWLKDLMVQSPGKHDAMINYESLVIAANKELTAAGQDPLVAVYPADGIAVSDSPLGYLDHGQDREEAFKGFQDALASDDAKLELERAGRRCGLGGKLTHADDSQVQEAFRADWGITQDASVLRTAPLPSADVMRQALTLYQTALRKPAYTIWVVDYSGSMVGAGKDGVVQGLSLALDPTQASSYLIQPAEGDVNVLIPFNNKVIDDVRADGTDTQNLLTRAQTTEAHGGTNMYAGLLKALDDLPQDVGSYNVAIVLMSDGQSLTTDAKNFQEAYQSLGLDVPIFPIMFADADDSQLKPLAEMSGGKLFDGRSEDLAATFREVKGYN